MNISNPEDVVLTISATDIGGYNGISVTNLMLNSPLILGDVYFTCFMYPTNTYDPIQDNLTCSFSSSNDPRSFFSGMYQLFFTLSDGTWNIPYTPEKLVALGYNPYINVTGAFMPEIVGIQFNTTSNYI
jgi:hypothetical protein